MIRNITCLLFGFIDQYYDEDPEKRKKGPVGSLNEIIHFYGHSE